MINRKPNETMDEFVDRVKAERDDPYVDHWLEKRRVVLTDDQAQDIADSKDSPFAPEGEPLMEAYEDEGPFKVWNA